MIILLCSSSNFFLSKRRLSLVELWDKWTFGVLNFVWEISYSLKEILRFFFVLFLPAPFSMFLFTYIHLVHSIDYIKLWTNFYAYYNYFDCFFNCGSFINCMLSFLFFFISLWNFFTYSLPRNFFITVSTKFYPFTSTIYVAFNPVFV